MTTLPESTRRQVEAANRSGKQPILFIHGLWLLSSSWARWAAFVEEAGYVAVTPGWPDDPETVKAANEKPQLFARKTIGEVADHHARIIAQLQRKPALIGHSFGGLLVQMLAGRGAAAATVAVDPAPFRGVLPLPVTALRSSLPVLRSPLNWGRAVSLSYAQFRFAFANAVTEDQARELYETFAVPASGAPIFQAATANLNPWTEARVKTTSTARGPLLVVSGERDHVVPRAMAQAAFNRQSRNQAVTDFVEMPNRGHSLTVDDGWWDVADRALAFIKRFT